MTEYETILKLYVDALAKMQYEMAKQRGWLYFGVESIVAAVGRFDTAQPLPEGIKRGKMKQCFQNAFELMDEGFIYVEGIAIPKCIGFPVHHAWCVDQFSNVIDPTWTDGVVYFGVHLNKSFVYQRALRRGRYGIFDNVEARDFYEKGLPKDALLPSITLCNSKQICGS